MERRTPNCQRRERMLAMIVLVTPSDETPIAAKATELASNSRFPKNV